MTANEKKNLMRWNTILWMVAMILPAVLSLALAGTKFPWQIVVPFLLFGCLLGSKKMLAEALGQSANDAKLP
jgi:hypothetical protein